MTPLLCFVCTRLLYDCSWFRGKRSRCVRLFLAGRRGWTCFGGCTCLFCGRMRRQIVGWIVWVGGCCPAWWAVWCGRGLEGSRGLRGARGVMLGLVRAGHRLACGFQRRRSLRWGDGCLILGAACNLTLCSWAQSSLAGAFRDCTFRLLLCGLLRAPGRNCAPMFSLFLRSPQLTENWQGCQGKFFLPGCDSRHAQTRYFHAKAHCCAVPLKLVLLLWNSLEFILLRVSLAWKSLGKEYHHQPKHSICRFSSFRCARMSISRWRDCLFASAVHILAALWLFLALLVQFLSFFGQNIHRSC